ncbi:hypothetical protein Hypma_004592 [Hypsizygus marmoreus]|uniref:BTB domain-containing protein n=1 Tax=Hypsizygus marmoreus TaxID=39966 RepID=A0A369K5L7_HYPMA|nr:hypothetical protein Hypma_004592 [Hypsizygus marmoreus]
MFAPHSYSFSFVQATTNGTSSDKVKIRVSERFKEEDADVTFQSSDGVLFRIHAFHLKACTEGFSPPECAKFEEIVPLTETASTLELLFQFIYPIPQPDLALLEFPILESLAESAEKYQVFPAMNICKLYMRNLLPDHMETVFAYAQKHDYVDVITQIVPLLLVKPLEESAAMMSSRYILPWIKYYTAWAQVASTAIISSPKLNECCGGCSSSRNGSELRTVILKLAEGPRYLQDLDNVFQPSCCTNEGNEYFGWRKSVEASVKAIPNFAELISQNETRQHITFADPWEGSNVVVKSEDGNLFYLHRANLERFATGLRPSTVDEIISSTESASTLELVFRFIYPVRQPDLEFLDFSTLASLALAVEKYKVHSAMAICRLHMKYALPNHPHTVMRYAAKNKFYDLMNTAAPLIIGLDVEESLLIMTEDLAIPWLRYQEQWNAIARMALYFSSKLTAMERNLPGYDEHLRIRDFKFRGCKGCRVSLDVSNMRILCKLGQGATVLRDLDDIFDLGSACCEIRKIDLRSWRSSVEEGIRGIPKFNIFV